MSKLSVSLAISDYDHVRDFVYGRVTAEGLDINFQVLPTPEIFDRATRDQEWDVCEMSLGKWTGMFSQGDDSLVPIPVFPSRVFRHSALYVKKGSGVDTLDKLRGKRVGDPDFAHTAGIYARGYLMHDVGIKLEEIEWVQAGTNKPGRHENLELNLPATVKRVSVPDKTLDDMLLGRRDRRDPLCDPAQELHRRQSRTWCGWCRTTSRSRPSTSAAPASSRSCTSSRSSGRCSSAIPGWR